MYCLIQLLCCDVFFIIEYVNIKHDCKNCVSISMDRSLHINLDDAPLAHRSLDAVLIASNMKGNKIPSGLVHLCLAVNSL